MPESEPKSFDAYSPRPLVPACPTPTACADLWTGPGDQGTGRHTQLEASLLSGELITPKWGDSHMTCKRPGHLRPTVSAECVCAEWRRCHWPQELASSFPSTYHLAFPTTEHWWRNTYQGEKGDAKATGSFSNSQALKTNFTVEISV